MTEAPHRTAVGSGTPVWKWLVIGLVTILVIGLVAVFPLLRPPAERPAGIAELKGAGDGFTIVYPEGWVQLGPEELEKLGQVYTSAAISEDLPAIVGVRALSVGLEDQPGVPKIRLSVLSDRVVKTLSARFKDFEEMSTSTIRLSGKEKALELKFQFRGEDKALMRGHSLIVPTDKQVYFVLGSTTEESYAEIEPDFARIFETFRITY